MTKLFENQIAMAMIVFIIIVVSSVFLLDKVTFKDVVIQVITAVGSMVTGQVIGQNKRSTDKIEQIDDAAKIKVAEVEAKKTIEAATETTTGKEGVAP